MIKRQKNAIQKPNHTNSTLKKYFGYDSFHEQQCRVCPFQKDIGDYAYGWRKIGLFSVAGLVAQWNYAGYFTFNP
jgi:hypothetical protein